MIKLMTPGPTQVRENVRLARSQETTNPDIDSSFYEEYRDLCRRISRLLHTENETFILSGEGILGLEAACASLTEPGDRVLVIDNGIYGAGFADFVTLYGGIPIVYHCPYEETVDVQKLEHYLAEDHDFKYATIVHHDTPSGMLNDVHGIGPLLHSYGILSVVDSVSAMIGEELYIDQGELDIVCGGSQKAFSAPAGLTLLTVSERALVSMKARRTPVASFYANILIFEDYYEKQWFPYTMPISDIYGLREAVSNIEEEPDIVGRHRDIAESVREAVRKAGLSLYGKNGYSNLTTAIEVPEGINSEEVIQKLKEKFGILITGSFGPFAGRILRLGHMGENANAVDTALTLAGLQFVLQELGVAVMADMRTVFWESWEERRKCRIS